MSFAGIHPAVRATLTSCLDIPVMFHDECIDLLATFEIAIDHDVRGYCCTLCSAYDRKFFPTREALWIAEIFEPFLDWSNIQLAEANFLEIIENPNMTSAKLHQHQPETFSLPLKSVVV